MNIHGHTKTSRRARHRPQPVSVACRRAVAEKFSARKLVESLPTVVTMNMHGEKSFLFDQEMFLERVSEWSCLTSPDPHRGDVVWLRERVVRGTLVCVVATVRGYLGHEKQPGDRPKRRW